MKKSLYAGVVFLAVLAGCYKDETVSDVDSQYPLTKANVYMTDDRQYRTSLHKITPDRAKNIAEEAKILFSDENERMIRTFSAGTTLEPVAVTAGQPRSRTAAGTDTLLFVVNYRNDGGLVFVSNDDRDGEILLYAEDGNFAMQDTAGNPVLKMHVDMLLAYQDHKLSEMRAAEARGEEYTGSMTTDEVSIDEILPNIAAAAGSPSGLPGGLPGQPHVCNVTGLPGSSQRPDICAPAQYDYKS